jgi:hypothetical protein
MLDAENSETDGAEVLDQVQAWRKQGAQLHEKLLAERSQLVARLKEIDAALALLPGSKPTSEAIPTELTALTPTEAAPNGDAKASGYSLSVATLRKLSMPQLVKMAVITQPGGINASGVVDFVQRVNPKATAALVHSGLYRNLESKSIRSEGTRGTRIYYPAAKAQEADVDG